MGKIVRIRVLWLLTFLLSSFFVFGQNDTLKDLFINAEYDLLFDDYKNALHKYGALKETGVENANINYRIGLCLLNIPGRESQAIPFLKDACKNISTDYEEGSYEEQNAPIVSIKFLGDAYHLSGKFEKAIKCYRRYLSYLTVKDIDEINLVKRKIQSSQNAKNLLSDITDEQSIAIFKNDTANELSPVLSPSGTYLCFLNDNAICISRVESLEKNITNIEESRFIRFTPCFINDSADFMIMAGEKSDETYLYSLYRKDSVWSKPMLMPKAINISTKQTSAYMTKDQDTLYFSSNASGGYGEEDIYIAVKMNGRWKTENIGLAINSSYDEKVLSIKGDKLFFLSEAHYNMGDFDVFYVVKNIDGYSQAINRGSPINTVKSDENTFPVSTEVVYKSIYKEGRYKICKLNITESNSLKQDKMVTITGVVNFGTDNPDDYIIKILKEDRATEVISLRPHPGTGVFNCKLPPGNYVLMLEGGLSMQQSKFLFIPEKYISNNPVIHLNLSTGKAIEERYMVVKSILFDEDKKDLNTDARIELDRLAVLLLSEKNLLIQIEKFDTYTKDEFIPVDLIKKRINTIAEYLLQKGLSTGRIMVKYPETDSIFASSGDFFIEDVAVNRRIDIKIKKIVFELDSLNAEETPKTVSKEYTVLLSARNQKIDTDLLSSFSDVIDIQNEYNKNNLYLYYAGNYTQKEAAANLLETAREMGFVDAKIIEKTELDSFEQSTVDSKENFVFSIQIKSTQNPNESKYLGQLENVRVQKNPSGWIRYFYGIYHDIDSALIDKDKLITLGFSDAFIKTVNANTLSVIPAVKQEVLDSLVAENTNKNEQENIDKEVILKEDKTQNRDKITTENNKDSIVAIVSNDTRDTDIENKTPEETVADSKFENYTKEKKSRYINQLQDANTNMYRVQVACVPEKAKNIGFFNQLKDVYEVKSNDKMIRYITGEFDDYQKAKEYLQEVRTQTRFKDAFISADKTFYKNNIQGINNIEENVAYYNFSEEEYSKAGPEKAVEESKQFYAVQFASSIELDSNPKFDYIDSVQVSQASNGYYRYFTGKFDSYNPAKEALKAIRQNYPDAFIINYPEKKIIEVKQSPEQIIRQKETIYTIQIASVLKPGKINHSLNEDEIFIIEGEKYNIYLFGQFKSINEAKMALREVKQAGFTDAFINKRHRYLQK